MYQVVNPATGQVEANYPTATDEQIEDILTRSAAAARSWRQVPIEERARLISEVGRLHTERAADLALIIAREMGKVVGDGTGEAQFAGSIYQYYADNGPRLLADEPIPADSGTAVIRRSPIGSLIGVMPWNYPYYQIARFAGPNLIAGNTIILKHAPQCPESALAVEAIFREAGVPDDAYINVFATNEQIAAMIADPRVAGVSVTGSERAGTAVAAQAGAHLKKVVLELGGSDPYIVLDAEDLDGVATAVAAARMENGGQACNAAKRIIVADAVYDQFVPLFTEKIAGYRTGNPTDPDVNYGPLSSARAAEILMEQIDDAIAKGAQVLTGGSRVDSPGAFVEPTVLAGVTPEMRAFREELFGPAAVVYRVSSADEAVELANSSAYGLGAAVFTQDLDLARSIADQIDTGMVYINSSEDVGGPELPFGGTKRSGVGRELGPLGIDEFVNKKLIHI